MENEQDGENKSKKIRRREQKGWERIRETEGEHRRERVAIQEKGDSVERRGRIREQEINDRTQNANTIYSSIYPNNNNMPA